MAMKMEWKNFWASQSHLCSIGSPNFSVTHPDLNFRFWTSRLSVSCVKSAEAVSVLSVSQRNARRSVTCLDRITVPLCYKVPDVIMIHSVHLLRNDGELMTINKFRFGLKLCVPYIRCAKSKPKMKFLTFEYSCSNSIFIKLMKRRICKCWLREIKM